jgi:hypothetical protein
VQHEKSLVGQSSTAKQMPLAFIPQARYNSISCQKHTQANNNLRKKRVMKNQLKMIVGTVIGCWAMSGCLAVGVLLSPLQSAARKR